MRTSVRITSAKRYKTFVSSDKACNTSERRCVTLAGLSEIVSSILGAGWLAGETNNPY